jgi:hypothetical protein
MPSREGFSYMMGTQQRVKDPNHRRAVIGNYSVRFYENEDEHFPLDIYLPKVADPANPHDRLEYSRFKSDMRGLANRNSFKMKRDQMEDMNNFMDGGEAQLQQMYGLAHELSSKGKRVDLPKAVFRYSQSGTPAPAVAHRLRMMPTQLANYHAAEREFASKRQKRSVPVIPNPFEESGDVLTQSKQAPLNENSYSAGGGLPGIPEARESQPNVMRRAGRLQFGAELAVARGNPLGSQGYEFNYVPERKDWKVRNDGTPFEEVSPIPALLDRMDVAKQTLKGVVAAQPMHSMYQIGNGGKGKLIPRTVEEDDDGNVDFQPWVGVFNKHNRQPMY